MKVRLELSREAEVDVEVDPDTGVPVAVVFTPIFSSRTAQVTLATGVAESEGSPVVWLDKFSLVVSGASGKVSKKSRTGDVKPLCDMTEEERKSAKQEEDS